MIEDTRRPQPKHPEGLPVSFKIYGGEVMEALDRIMPKLGVGDLVRITVPWALDRGPAARTYGEVKIPAMTDVTYEVEFYGQFAD